MKDFRLRNDTVLLFRNEPFNEIEGLTAGKKVLFVYGGASVYSNGCYDDVRDAVSAGRPFPESEGIRGIRLAGAGRIL